MENPTPQPHSSNPHSQTLLHNPTNHVNQTAQKKAMKNFQEFIFKLAETHPNAPLTPPSKTLLQGRLHQFVSEYKTPDHPPYSAMIERALQELNEKRGSSEESISQYLERRYDYLPWAHSVLLKHHLEKLCESGEIVVTRDKRYGLPGCLNSSRAIKRKPPRRKWRWEWERVRNNQRKKKLRKKRNQQKFESDEVIQKQPESDEKERQLTENGAHSEDKSDQTKGLLSRVHGENGNGSNPSSPSGVNDANEKKYSEEVRSQELEIGPSETVKDDICAAYTQKLQEREKYEYSQPELSSPERPPGFESIEVENLSHLGSTELEIASAEEFIGSKRTWRQLKRWSRRLSEPKAVTVTSLELVTSPKPEEGHSLQSEHDIETPPDQQKAPDSALVTEEQMHHEKQILELPKADVVEVVQSVRNDVKLKGDETYCQRRKNKFKKSETNGIHVSEMSEQPTVLQNEHIIESYATIDSPNLSLTLNQEDSALPDEQEPQKLLQQPSLQQEDIFQGKQLRRSLRARPAKHGVFKDANFVDVLLPQPCPEECRKKVYRNQGTPSKQRPGNKPLPEPTEAACTDGLQHPPKCRRLGVRVKPKPDAADVDDHRGRGLKQSGKPADCTSICEKMESPRTVEVLLLSNPKQKLQEVQPTKRRLGRLPKRCSARPLINKMKSPDIE